MLQPTETRAKWFISIMMIAILGFTLIKLQQCFDEGDYKYALQLLGSKRPGETWSLGQELLLRSGEQTPNCTAKLISSFRGTLEVTCAIPSGKTYHFNVDRVRQTITPADPETSELFEVVTSKNQGGADGGNR